MTAAFWPMYAASVGLAKAKDEVAELIRDLPDDVSLEDIQYHLYVRQRVSRGEAEADSGKTISQDEMRGRLDKWLVR